MNTAVGSSPAPDTTPPTVALNSPVPGSTVFGLVSVSAVAADDILVTGVQFFVDGAPLGDEAISAAVRSPLGHDEHVGESRPHRRGLGHRAGIARPARLSHVTVTTPTPSLVGQWGSTFAWPIVPVHATLLPTGQVLASDGQGNGGDARLWNPTTNGFTAVPNTAHEHVLCRPLWPARWKGARRGRPRRGRTSVFPTRTSSTPTNKRWTLVRSMSYPRWYPTATALPMDGCWSRRAR